MKTSENFFPYFGTEIEFEDNRSKTMPCKVKGTLIGIHSDSVEVRVNNNITLWYPINSVNVIFHLKEQREIETTINKPKPNEMKDKIIAKQKELNDCRKGLINILERRIADGELSISVLKMAEDFRQSIWRLESKIAALEQESSKIETTINKPKPNEMKAEIKAEQLEKIIAKQKELKSCPFCGGKAKIYHHIDSSEANCYYIQCSKCELSFNNCWGTYETYNISEEVVKWNNRARGQESKEQKPTEGEHYKKVYIESEADLPKEDGDYIVCKRYSTIPRSVFEERIVVFKYDTKYPESWSKDIIWYFLPIEQESKEAEIIKALSGEKIEDIPTFTSTEEEILDRNLIGVNKDKLMSHFDFKPSVIKAMHEYAQQIRREEFIKFYEWKMKKNLFSSENKLYKSIIDEYLNPKL